MIFCSILPSERAFDCARAWLEQLWPFQCFRGSVAVGDDCSIFLALGASFSRLCPLEPNPCSISRLDFSVRFPFRSILGGPDTWDQVLVPGMALVAGADICYQASSILLEWWGIGEVEWGEGWG